MVNTESSDQETNECKVDGLNKQKKSSSLDEEQTEQNQLELM